MGSEMCIRDRNYGLSSINHCSTLVCIILNDAFISTVAPGFYIRQLREPSLTDPSVFILLCEYFTVYPNDTASLYTILYMDGDSCVDTTATPLLMESSIVQSVATDLVNLTVPLSDDTRSDFLGAYDQDPTDDTASRYGYWVIVRNCEKAVSYTHLTLPTIYSV